jgi:hypothetical protein
MKSIKFRTLSGEHCIELLSDETKRQALARYFNVSPKRITIHKVNNQYQVVILEPIHHKTIDLNYTTPPGYLELYRQNLDKLDWSKLSGNGGAFEILRDNLNKADWKELPNNDCSRVKQLVNRNMENVDDGGMKMMFFSDACILEATKRIDCSKIKWKRVSLFRTPSAIEFLSAHQEKIDWKQLSTNDCAMDLLLENADKIDWTFLSINPHPTALKMLSENAEKIDWTLLSMNENPQCVDLLKSNFEKIEWKHLSANPIAIQVLTENMDKIVWSSLSCNESAIDLLASNLDKVNWIEFFSSNYKTLFEDLVTKSLNTDWVRPYFNRSTNKVEIRNTDFVDWNAISLNSNDLDLLEANIDQINWRLLSLNRNPNTIQLLSTHQDKIDWEHLCLNPRAIKLLAANTDKINWTTICQPIEWMEY